LPAPLKVGEKSSFPPLPEICAIVGVIFLFIVFNNLARPGGKGEGGGGCTANPHPCRPPAVAAVHNFARRPWVSAVILPLMNFCSHCGQSVRLRIPQGDSLARHVCAACGTIHYQNPKIVAGCIAVHGGRVLLCRRAIAPRSGLWTIPAGFMENGETVAEAAARETREEALAAVTVGGLYALYNLPHRNQVYMIFTGALPTPHCAAGSETLEAALVEEEEIPWDELAFRVVTKSLQRFFADRRRGRFETHMDTLE